MIEIALLTLAWSAVFLVPGIGVTTVWGGTRSLPPYTLLPAAVCVSIACHAIAIGLGFLLDIPLLVTTWGVVAAGGLGILVSASRGRPPWLGTYRPFVRTAVFVALVLSVLVGAVASGGVTLKGRLSDTLFHMGIITKISESSIVDIQQLAFFADGIPHPSYILPVWHAMVAATTVVPGTDAQVALDVTTALVASVAVFAWLSLGRALLGHDVLAVVAAGGMVVLRVISTAPDMRVLHTLSYPGNVALEVVLPLTLACLLWSIRRLPQTERAWALVLLGIGTALLIVLHANYVIYLLLAGLGYLAVRAARWRQRDDWPLHTWPILVVAGTSAGVGLPLLAKLRTLDRFGRGTSSETLEQVRSNWTETLRLVDGQLVMDTNHFLGLGALAFIGLVAIVALSWMRDAQSAPSALVCGMALGVFGLSLIPSVLTYFAGVGDAAFVVRAHRALVLMPAVVMAVALLSRHLRGRAASAVAVAAAAVGIAAATMPNRLSGRDQIAAGQQFLPDAAVWLAVGALVAGVLSWLFRRPEAGDISVRVRTTATVCVLLFAPSALLGLARYIEAPAARGNESFALSALQLPADIQRELRRGAPERPYGYHVVAAKPQLAYSVQAYFPAYVTAINKVKLASGGMRSNEERVLAWDVATAEDASQADVEDFLVDADPTLVLAPAVAMPMRTFLAASPDWEPVAPRAFRRVR